MVNLPDSETGFVPEVEREALADSIRSESHRLAKEDRLEGYIIEKEVFVGFAPGLAGLAHSRVKDAPYEDVVGVVDNAGTGLVGENEKRIARQDAKDGVLLTVFGSDFYQGIDVSTKRGKNLQRVKRAVYYAAVASSVNENEDAGYDLFNGVTNDQMSEEEKMRTQRVGLSRKVIKGAVKHGGLVVESESVRSLADEVKTMSVKPEEVADMVLHIRSLV